MRSPLTWIGGKSLLADKIIEMIPEHKQYCEVFAGAGWVFFKKERSRYEALNDINSDLVAFYRVLQHHLEEFCKQFKFLLTSREWFEDWKRQQEAGGLTDIQRAARFYYLQRLTFGGKVAGRTFGSTALHHPRINLVRLEEELSQVHLRLASVTIEHLPWSRCIDTYDRPETFFYLDPPYWDCENFYGKGIFSKEDFQLLSSKLLNVQGKFILSLNDTPEVRRLFMGFKITPVTTRYSCHKAKSIKASELLISNC